MDKNSFIRPDIAHMPPYHPILPLDRLSAQLGIPMADLVKLDANENPYGASPKALAAIRSGQLFHMYPDPESTQLREKLAQLTAVSPTNLLVGMGADELIDLILRVVLSPRDTVIDCPPTFGMYPFSTTINAGQYLPVPRHPDFSLNLPAIEQAVANTPNAKILFLCSPNNPNGSIIPDHTLRRLLALPLLIVLDEAYIDFAQSSGHASHLSWVTQHDNLAVLRTFSKLAGLAGLRVGYGAFPNWLLPHLWKIKQPYNVNVAAQLAASAALDDLDWLREKSELIVQERKRLTAALQQQPHLFPYPSHANFVLCRVEGQDAGQLKQLLAQQGILVRYFEKPGLQNCLRISVGTPQQTDKLLTALNRILPPQIHNRR